MYANGLYIQDVSKDMANFLSEGKFRLVDRVYNGVARYIDDPLCRIHDPITEAISKKIYEGEYSVYRDCSRNGNVNPLWVITNIEYYNEYIMRCDELNIQTRTLFIESTQEFPLWRGELPNLEPLGYEVVSVDLSEISFCEVLNSKNYKHYAEKLNQYGLFDDFETAEAFYDELNEKEDGLIEECDGLIVRISVLKNN